MSPVGVLSPPTSNAFRTSFSGIFTSAFSNAFNLLSNFNFLNDFTPFNNNIFPPFKVSPKALVRTIVPPINSNGLSFASLTVSFTTFAPTTAVTAAAPLNVPNGSSLDTLNASPVNSLICSLPSFETTNSIPLLPNLNNSPVVSIPPRIIFLNSGTNIGSFFSSRKNLGSFSLAVGNISIFFGSAFITFFFAIPNNSKIGVSFAFSNMVGSAATLNSSILLLSTLAFSISPINSGANCNPVPTLPLAVNRNPSLKITSSGSLPPTCLIPLTPPSF